MDATAIAGRANSGVVPKISLPLANVWIAQSPFVDETVI